ncbi:hypothetical protein F5J12DRAFT_804084 [Pisolithus orientalis]|uniref:uncharacterized protein n=1 Tax=Pisolithus orientalis TaxID=936130 RepID=UPI002225149E|nr:uncharacterized protein F5J12DRAFT_804084 [Pisolithus orientalis]KAI6030940.1 hypothetical protein F5J12DRAFT_804084 [Pisolithus orientalis]
MYYRQQATSHARRDDSDAGHTPDHDSQPNQRLPPINSMSLPGMIREQDYRTFSPAVPAPGYPSSSSQFLYPSQHQHLQPSLQPHLSSWNRLPYLLDQSGDPSPGRDHMHRFTPQHQHHPDSLHRTEDTSAATATFMPEDVPFSNTAQLESNLMMTRQRPMADHPPVPYPSHQVQSSQSPPRAQESPNSRRMKPRIGLAPDQPLTTQGKPRARVYVACVQCRTRKIRCDGAKPACHNCTRRAKADDECTYDAAPKRRGPDKVPGARQRVSRETRTDRGSGNVRRRRRRGDEGDANNGSNTAFSDDASERDEGIGCGSPPIRPPSLVLDPQLSDMTTFVGGIGGVVAATPLAASQISRSTPTSTSTAVLDGGLGSVILSSAEGFAEEIMYATNSQSLNNTQVYDPSILPLPPLPGSVFENRDVVQYFIRQQPPQNSEEAITLSSEPSLEFVRKTWWESLLAVYSTDLPLFPNALTAMQRHHASSWITADLRFLFRTSSYWFSFINVPSFLSTFMDPQKREKMQPSFAYATLAVATLLQSSEVGTGSEGREKALRLRDMAQGALEASLCARWVDEEVAQAAWLLAFFELCPHPRHAGERTRSSLLMLDSIIRVLSLATLDKENPAAVRFNRNTVPVVLCPRQTSPSSLSSSRYDANEGVNAFDGMSQSYPIHGCACASLSLGQSWPASHEHAPLLVATPGWDDAWTSGEIRKETCRRLCWHSMMLTAGFLSYIHSARLDPPDLFIGEPANIALLFPAEAMISRYEAHWVRDTVWALNYRTTLLWHSCLRLLRDPNVSEADRARFGVNAWLEADILEQALDSHTCGMESSYYQGREYLFNVRYTISNEFQKYIPITTINTSDFLHRGKAEECLKHQANIAERLVQTMGALTGRAGQLLAHRPLFTFWFMGQINRALSLWERDNSLTLAVDVCVTLFKPIDYLSAVWPCRAQTAKAVALRAWLARACEVTGRPPPPPGPLSVL